MGLFSTNVNQISREKALEIARQNIAKNRDDMELITKIHPKNWALTVSKFSPPAGFCIYWAKRDSWDQGHFYVSISQSPFGWMWLKDNHVIMVFPDGTRMNFEHRVGWNGNVLEAGQVSEYKAMDLTEAVASLDAVFDQDAPLRLRVGPYDYSIDSRYFAYFKALREEVERLG